MNDNTAGAGSQDPERIHVDEEAELHEWAKKLDSTPMQIREAVQAVGDRAANVEMHLKGTRSTTNADQEDRAEGGQSG